MTSASRRALIIDDEPDIRELLGITLGRMQLDCVAVGDLESAYDELQRGHFDICLADLRLPDGDGMDLVAHIGQHYSELPVAVITAHGNMEVAIEALKHGAFDFINKPIDLANLRQLVASALKLNAGASPSSQPSDSAAKQLLGHSRGIEQVRQLVKKLARSQAPVFIGGESGTGKELAARSIHTSGPRADAPFVAVNCGAIPADLIESELFGHVKGSFTGAVKDRQGLFEAAHGGTLFLDEVADLPLAMQVKLLRVLQEKTIRPVGSSRELAVDVRIISASHKNLAALVEAGALRNDLYYRIKVIEITMPPLRERPEDLQPLFHHFLAKWAQQTGMPEPKLDLEAVQALMGYQFPGNVRELENMLERASTLCESGVIKVADLGLPSFQMTHAPGPQAADVEASVGPIGLEEQLMEVERGLITKALEATQWNRSAAAKQLGLSLRSLRYRMSKLGL